jgi:hypothetical protein
VTGLVGATTDADAEAGRLHHILEHAADPDPFDAETAALAIVAVSTPFAPDVPEDNGSPFGGGAAAAKAKAKGRGLWEGPRHEGSTGKWVVIVSLDREFSRSGQM